MIGFAEVSFLLIYPVNFLNRTSKDLFPNLRLIMLVRLVGILSVGSAVSSSLYKRKVKKCKVHIS